MKKVNWKFAAWAFAAVAAISGGVYASGGWHALDDGGAATGTRPSGPFEGCYSSCGGEIPWPFQVSNQAVELSDGEKYLLMGTVEILHGRAFFVVDLVKHPWLATAKRRENPRYMLQGATDYWKGYEGKRIRLVSTAAWSMSQDVATREYTLAISLHSLADPAIVAEKADNVTEPTPGSAAGQATRE